MNNIKKTIITVFCLIILGVTIFPMNGLAFIIRPPPGGRSPPTDPPILEHPPTPDNDGKITLAWSESARATGYKLFRSTSYSGGYQIIKMTSQLSYTDQVPTSGYWYYKVRAYNIDGDSPFSNIVSVEVISEDELAWWCDDVDAEKVWGGYEDAKDVNTNIHGSDINVCIIDSGADYNHIDLDDNYIDGYDCITGDDAPMDESDSGHGTHVAGIVAMEDNEVGYIGIAPNVSLYILRIDDDLPTSQIIDALDWAINTHTDPDPDNDIHIISMSFGGFEDYAWQDWEIIDISDKLNTANQTGIVLVAAAGNYYNYPGYPTEVMFPACHPEVIAVGAVNSEFYRANVSNTGYWGSCYGDELDLVAPGVDIISTTYGNTWSELNGTSFACPIVTGVCVLILSKALILSKDLTPYDIRTILHDTATKVGAVTYENGWHEKYGYGMVDAEDAVNAVQFYI